MESAKPSGTRLYATAWNLPQRSAKVTAIRYQMSLQRDTDINAPLQSAPKNKLSFKNYKTFISAA